MRNTNQIDTVTVERPEKNSRNIGEALPVIRVRWTGIRPLLMHNGRLADPEDPIVQQIKEINNTRAKDQTDVQTAEMSWLKWSGGLYWDETAGAHIPTDNIERCIQLGAQKNRKGKQVQAACFVKDTIVALHYDGPKTREGLYKDARFSLRRGVRIQKNRIMSVRPMFPKGWFIEFDLEFDATIIKNKEELLNAMREAGALVGLGDWRPKFGRFLVEEL